MLDAFKNMAGGKGTLAKKQTDELEQLITTAREERSAISAMLTSLTARSAKLTPLGARRSHARAGGSRKAHPGLEGVGEARRGDDRARARAGRRAAEAPRGG